MTGWISLHRKTLENPVICKDADYFAIWCYLLLSAAHREHAIEFRGQRLILKEGQLITGRKTISEKFNISESKVQRVLKRFENEQQIEQQTTNENRLISILRWKQYQQDEQQSEQPVNNERTTSEQPVNTYNNINNINNDNNENNVKKKRVKTYRDVFSTFTDNEELKTTLSDFNEMRNRIKKPLSDKAKELLIKELNKLSTDESEQIAILNQSIFNSWQGVYPLKGQAVNHSNPFLELLQKEGKA